MLHVSSLLRLVASEKPGTVQTAVRLMNHDVLPTFESARGRIDVVLSGNAHAVACLESANLGVKKPHGENHPTNRTDPYHPY